MDAAPGVPDRYTLLSPLGHGAMGTVWRARDEALGREVAIKVVRLAGPGSPTSLSRFRRETEATAAIDDPRVVRVHDAGSDLGVAWLVMELLPGPSVAALVADEGPLPWDRGLALAEDVARGLAAAHAAGVVHRDIKPGNVVLRDTQAVIVDFGIARLAETVEGTHTATGVITGTAAYLAPEQARGETVTPATDLYSFGCLLTTMFTGTSPFTAELAVAQAFAHVSTPPPRLAERRPDVPPALDELVARLLEKDPALRPDAATTADELARIRGDRSAASGLSPIAPTEQTAPLTRLDAMLDSGAATPRRATAGRRGRTSLVPLLAVLGVALVAVAALVLQPGGAPAGPTTRPGAGARSTTTAATPGLGPTPEGTSATAAVTPEEASTAGEVPTPVADETLPPAAPTTRAPTQPVEPTQPGTTAPAPAPATVPAPALAGVADAIARVDNPGGRRQLERAWSDAASGLTTSNAASRADALAAVLATLPQLTDGERAAVLAALQRVRAAGA